MNAREIAEKYHEGQFYGDVSYFVGHICDVAARVVEVGDLIHVYVAYLHDVIEDTPLTFDELRILLDEEVWERKFIDDVICAVEALTKRKGEDYNTYMSRVMENNVAAFVKYYDSEANMYACIRDGDSKRAQKYLQNMCLLRDFV